MSDLVVNVDALVLKPGDTLLVRLPVGSRREQADAVAAALVEGLPGVPVVVVAAEQLAAYRPESRDD